MSPITIIPEGGLCNRMRAINAARHLARHLNLPLRIEWITNRDLNCPYQQLFDAPVLNLKNRSNLYLPALVSRLKRKSKFIFKFSNLLERFFDIQIIDSNELLNLDKDQIAVRIENRKKTYLCAWFGFFGPDDFTGFNPSPSVQKVTDTLTEKFNPQTVGIHIRRTDNAISIAWSPIELFIEKIKSYPTHTNFFLATDSTEVKTRLQQIFSERIITPNGDLSRNSTQGMVQAAAELFALSRSCELLASHWSSFSDAAAQIGNIPKIVIQKIAP